MFKGVSSRCVFAWQLIRSCCLTPFSFVNLQNPQNRYFETVPFDGKRVVSGSHDKTVRVWDASTGKELHTLKGHREPIINMAFAADGTRIVSGSADGWLLVWDSSRGAHLSGLHTKTAIKAMAVRPDGKRVATPGEDRSVRIWELNP